MRQRAFEGPWGGFQPYGQCARCDGPALVEVAWPDGKAEPMCTICFSNYGDEDAPSPSTRVLLQLVHDPTPFQVYDMVGAQSIATLIAKGVFEPKPPPEIKH